MESVTWHLPSFLLINCRKSHHLSASPAHSPQRDASFCQQKLTGYNSRSTMHPMAKRNGKISKLVTEVVDGEPYQYYPLGEHVVRAIGVCSGRPTFKYTRIEITGTLERLAAGESLDEVVAGYRGRVSREAILEAGRIVTTQFLTTLPELAAA
jgi:uncharacterized protein (DUF433 family)